MLHALFIGLCVLLGWLFPTLLGPAAIAMGLFYIIYLFNSPQSRCRRFFIKLAAILIGVPGISKLIAMVIAHFVPLESQKPWLEFFEVLATPYSAPGPLPYYVLGLAALVAIIEMVMESRRLKPLTDKQITFELTNPKKDFVSKIGNSNLSGLEGEQVLVKFELVLRNTSNTPYSFNYENFVLSWGPFFTREPAIKLPLMSAADNDGNAIKVENNDDTGVIDVYVFSNAKQIMAMTKLPEILWPNPTLDFNSSAQTI